MMDVNSISRTQQDENAKLCCKCRALLSLHCPRGFVTEEIEEAAAARVRRRPNRTDMLREITTSHPLDRSAADGCPLCQRILGALSDDERNLMHNHWEMSIQYPNDSTFATKYFLYLDGQDPPTLSMQHELPLSLMANGRSEIKAIFQLLPSPEIDPFINYGLVGTNTNSGPSWEIVHHWMSSCTENHTMCNHSTETNPPLPPRVIEIRKDTNLPPRLCVTAGTSLNAKYATLSHCWGSLLPLRLLKSNFSALQESIPVCQLPRTFMDAIDIARSLGIDYIWIDCLCIIQDSIEDWQEQSGLMARIYSNSHCNIGAAHASDSRQGCFTERNPTLVSPLKLQLHWGPCKGFYYCVRAYFWRMNVLECPLNRRAWVCQERLLAPRKLFFGSTQIYWECCENRACEALPQRLPPQLRTFMLSGMIHNLRYARLGTPGRTGADPSADAFSIWDTIVREYTSGQLSYQKDKLVAVGGLAARVEEEIGSEYLAGLWRKHLAFQLLWQVYRLRWDIPRSRPSEYIAPTWSWASVVGRVESACDIRGKSDREIIIDVVDVAVQLSTQNRFGQVKDGFLTIKGYLAHNGVRVEEDETNRGSYCVFVNGVRAGIALLDEDNQGKEPTIHEGLYYLPVRFRSREISEVSGIVLRKTSIAGDDDFVRMGQFEVYAGYIDSFKETCRQSDGDSNEQNSQRVLVGEWGSQRTVTIY